jgi:RHS repeat-associated protein
MGGTSEVRFTGKEQDAETGLDYFGAGYMSAAQDRFTSPDVPLFAQHQGDPQSWNLYSYTANNLLTRIACARSGG